MQTLPNKRTSRWCGEVNYSVCWVTLRRAFQAEGIVVAKSWGRAPLARLMFCANGQSWGSGGEYLRPRQVEPHKPGSDFFLFLVWQEASRGLKEGKGQQQECPALYLMKKQYFKKSFEAESILLVDECLNEWTAREVRSFLNKGSVCITVLTCTFLKGDLLAGAVATLWLHRDANSWHCHWLLPVFSEVNISNHH